MKRSRSLSLLLMGSIAFGAVGCSSDTIDETYAAYNSVAECVSSNVFSEQECKDLATAALSQAPTFTSREECEAQFGADACQNTPASSAVAQTNATSSNVQPHTQSSWMPMMMGFMAGRYLGGGSAMQGSQPLFRGDPAQGGQSFRTAGGETVTRDAAGTVKNPSSSMKQSVTHNAKPMMSRSGSTSSGGFGGSKKFGSSGS